VRTELGDKLLAEIHATKRRLLASLLEDWPEDELRAFSVLFEKFVGRFESAYASEKTSPQPALANAS
jgi:hypothetical protein